MTGQELQQAILSKIGSGGLAGVVELPAEPIGVTDTIQIPSCIGLAVVGKTPAVSGVNWSGPADRPVINCSGVHHGMFRDFSIGNTTPSSAQLVLTRQPGEQFISTACWFKNVWFGDNTPKYVSAVEIVNPQGFDQNNECHYFERCEFTGYTRSAVRVHGGQIHALSFSGCGMNANLNADYGIECEYGSYIHWQGGTGGYHRVFDFLLKNFLMESTIHYWNSEGSGGLCSIEQSGWSPAPISIKHCRWDGNPVGHVISTLNVGPLTVEGNDLSTGVAGKKLTIQAVTLGGQSAGQLRVVGNAISAPYHYTKTKPLILAAKSSFNVEYHNNLFRDWADPTPYLGDQDVVGSAGLPVATVDQGGVVTADQQNLTANKTFVNTKLTAGSPPAGITINSVSSDGRTAIGSVSGDAAITFWNRWGLATANGQWQFDGMTMAKRAVFHAPGVSPFTTNANGLHWIVPSEMGTIANAWLYVLAMRYGADKQPGVHFGAREFRFGIVPDIMPAASNGAGKNVLGIDAQGITIGNVRLTPTDDGDLMINSPKFNNVLLSSFGLQAAVAIEGGLDGQPG